MNDDPTLTALRYRITEVRDSLGDVHMTIPASEIFARDRRRRARHWLAAAGGAAAAAAMAVSVALPASHPAASHPAATHPAATHPARGPDVQLAAWTVTRQADGSIQVTFREATDPAGLQRTLRADGVPVSVTFTGHQNPACQPYPSSGSQAKEPFGSAPSAVSGGYHNPAQSYTTPYALVIQPSALSSGAGLQIWTSGTPGAADNFQVNVGLVQASPQCTGS
jgi:hypothetical protein